ncbi:MAG: alpha/beta fold hydrolase [Deltaproteobacteria bacterium]|nr:alpha/beta fold hydrolase [Deltaproteobacteria bacterium]
MRGSFPLAVTLLALWGCGGEPSAVPEPQIPLEPCRLPGFGRECECGQLEVYENRQTREGRKIPLRIVRYPAQGSARQPDPLFLLAGGPGQAASEAYVPMLPAFGDIGLDRDLVLVDQRGSGSSAALDCAPPDDLADELRDDALEKLTKECRASQVGDLEQYTTAASADDLDDVRAALGYDRINLLGASYGTRLALVYAKRHETHVRSLVLDGVAPPDMTLPLSFAPDGQRALELILNRCEADDACRRAFPDLGDKLDGLLERLAAEPAQVSVRHPTTGKPLRFELTRDGFAQSLRNIMYSPELVALLPLTITQAAEGDFASFIALVALFVESSEGMSIGLTLSVLCREDVSHIAEAQIAKQSAGSFLGRSITDSFRRACEAWQVPRGPAETSAPVHSNAPTLALSGEADPATPPRWAERALQHLPNGRHVVVPTMGHGVSFRGCVPRLIRQLLDDPASVGTMDVSCADEIQAPRFFIDTAGPPH